MERKITSMHNEEPLIIAINIFLLLKSTRLLNARNHIRRTNAIRIKPIIKYELRINLCLLCFLFQWTKRKKKTDKSVVVFVRSIIHANWFSTRNRLFAAEVFVLNSIFLLKINFLAKENEKCLQICISSLILF